MKKFLSLLLAAALILALCVPGFAAGAQRSSQALTVNGVARTCDIYNIGGYNYFKLRDIAMLLNGTGSQFSVGWDASSQTVSVRTGSPYSKLGGELEIGADKSATAKSSPQTITINGVKKTGLSIYNIGGNNYFKLADLGAAIGFDVSYDAATRTVLVKSRGTLRNQVRLTPTADAGHGYLDKFIFIGDSTTYGIGYYQAWGYNGYYPYRDTLCPHSQVWVPKNGYILLSRTAIDQVYCDQMDQMMFIPDAAGAVKPAYMMITLGVDDISTISQQDFYSHYTKLVNGIKAQSPDTRIILNSIYPVAKSYQYPGSINPTKINTANEWVEQIAKDTGCRFLYSYECLVGPDGYLPENLQNGDGLHLTGDAFVLVMNYIRTHAFY